MSRSEILEQIIQNHIVAILRVKDPRHIRISAKALLAGGISSVEVSLNTPNAISCIEDISRIEGILPGAGTVTNTVQAIEAIEAGAQFVVTPISNREVIDTCHAYGKPVFSGALTPSEVFQAYEWGADVVKIFPAEVMPMKYIQTLKTPFPDIRLMPTGGVNCDNIDRWLELGADCVGIGGCFTSEAILHNEDWESQTKVAQNLVSNIRHYFEKR